MRSFSSSLLTLAQRSAKWRP